jgi:hypothetical protein
MSWPISQIVISNNVHEHCKHMASSEGRGSGSKKNKCEICGLVFEDSYALSYHKSVEHGKDKKPPSGVT